MSDNAADRIDAYIAKPNDWRTPVMARIRELIRDTAPELMEDWKWNSPTWSRDGHLISVSAFRKHVGVNFFDGAALADPERLFNGGLDAKRSRSVVIRESDTLDEAAFRSLVKAAVEYSRQNSER